MAFQSSESIRDYPRRGVLQNYKAGRNQMHNSDNPATRRIC